MDEVPNNFDFWAQKRGDSWISTGWRLRHFKCDVRQRTITYYKGNEAKGVITAVKASDPMNALPGQQAVDVLDAGIKKRVFHIVSDLSKGEASVEGVKRVLRAFGPPDTAASTSVASPAAQIAPPAAGGDDYDYDAFISYRVAADKHVAEKLYWMLEKEGLRVFW